VIRLDACDMCGCLLDNEMTQLDIVRGALVTRAEKGWGIASRPSGLRHYKVCRDCAGYLKAALRHLRALVSQERAAA